ncbi:hypothetical protein AWC00_00390 [Mycobacterium conspicuum]|nr:hypothetical protein AWC00_00390 [Mycobacterium conspicuum]
MVSWRGDESSRARLVTLAGQTDGMTSRDPPGVQFEQQRHQLFGYRMLASAVEPRRWFRMRSCGCIGSVRTRPASCHIRGLARVSSRRAEVRIDG